MARRTVTITSCDICGTAEGANEFWADVTFRSKQYEYDDGTNPQEFNWTLCRGCKVKLLEFMREAARQARNRDLMEQTVQVVEEVSKPKPKRKPKPEGPATCFERVSKGNFPDG